MRSVVEIDIPATEDEIEIEAPRGAAFVGVGNSPVERRLKLYAMVETTAPKSKRVIRVALSASELNGNLFYIGSLSAAPFAWHVFERTS